MQENSIALRILLPVLALAFLSGCGTMKRLFPDRSEEYRKSETTAPLDVPPDLTTTPVNDALMVRDGSATLSGYNSAARTNSTTSPGVMPTPENMTIVRDRGRAWLVVNGDLAAVWSRTREFWLESGFLIRRENPTLGVLETDWIDSRVSAPGDIIRNTISRVFQNAYSSSLRDRYRMRLESGEQPGTVEIYITHKGLQEKLEGRTDEIQSTIWEPRPRDPGLESEMLKQMMVYLGVAPQRAEQLIVSQQAPAPDKAELTKQGDGQPILVIHDGFSRAWRSVGITLDRIDFAVEDRDRSTGIYYVRYNDPMKRKKKGFLSKLAFWSSDEDTDQVTTYQIKLVDDGADTRVMVLNEQGEAEATITPVRILTLLYEELR